MALGRLYRSGALVDMTAAEKARLKNEIHLKTTIELASPDEPKRRGRSGCWNISARAISKSPSARTCHYFKTEMAMYPQSTNMGAIYLERMRHPALAQADTSS